MASSDRYTVKEFEKWLKRILYNEDIQDYEVNVQGLTENGDGYLGDLTFLKVSGKTKNGRPKKIDLVVKCSKPSRKLRETFPVQFAFENEIYVYETVLPAFKEFQEEKGIKEPFDSYAKNFGTLILDNMEVLFLQNLKVMGYEVHDRKKPMSFEHILAVVKEYGKLHAISFALKDQKPELFKILSEKLEDVMLMWDKEPPEGYQHFKQVIEGAAKINELEVVEQLLKYQEVAMQIQPILAVPDEYSVITHGDCWNNNFMFQYEDDERKTPVRVAFLDWQLSRLVSPIFDLSYFLFTCISYDDIHRFDEINEIYYNSLSNFMKKLGSDPDKLFPYEEFQKQWKRNGKFGLHMNPPLMRLVLSEKDEVPDLVQSAETGTEMLEVFTYEVKNLHEYEKRTVPVMKLAVQKGFLDMTDLDLS